MIFAHLFRPFGDRAASGQGSWMVITLYNRLVYGHFVIEQLAGLLSAGVVIYALPPFHLALKALALRAGC